MQQPHGIGYRVGAVGSLSADNGTRNGTSASERGAKTRYPAVRSSVRGVCAWEKAGVRLSQKGPFLIPSLPCHIGSHFLYLPDIQALQAPL
jgi:hypothetical protein